MSGIYQHKNGSQTVKITLHITPEADRVLKQYGGERSRGWFVSQLLMEKQKSYEQKEENREKPLVA